jgi:hypothetical protein
MDTADVVAIREAVKGLVREVIPKGYIIFGGHPAITPLIALLLRGTGRRGRKRLILYQSAYFEEQFVRETDEFLDVRIIPAVSESRERSLAEMRSRMIEDTKFDAGVFIGGMEGVLDEYTLFRSHHPTAAVWPIASTGAAARELFERTGRQHPELFMDQITYSSLFRELLSKLPHRPEATS